MLTVCGPSVQSLCDLGYSAMDIITTVFRVVRNYQMDEILKLEFIKVKTASTSILFASCLQAAMLSAEY